MNKVSFRYTCVQIAYFIFTVKGTTLFSKHVILHSRDFLGPLTPVLLQGPTVRSFLCSGMETLPDDSG